MKSDFLAKIVNFVKEKGEKFIIVSQEDAKAVVIMPFSEYERISGAATNPFLTESNEDDRINLEIGALPPRRENIPGQRNLEDWGGNESLNAGNDDRYYMEPLE